MDLSQILEAHKIVIALNLKLYEFQYGQTTEGRQRLKLYRGIMDTIENLAKNKIANLSSVQFNLSLVFPMMSMEYLSILAESVDRLKKKKPIDLYAYTEIVFYIASLSIQASNQMSKLLSLTAMRSRKKSRLDNLESKAQVLVCFKKILALEKANSSQGRDSAFAKVYQQELRPILQNTEYFKPRIEYVDNEEIVEKNHLTNDRAYKNIKKLYDTWKKNNQSKVKKLLQFFDHCIWRTPSNPDQWIPQNFPTQKSLEDLKNLLADIDNMLLAEK